MRRGPATRALRRAPAAVAAALAAVAATARVRTTAERAAAAFAARPPRERALLALALAVVTVAGTDRLVWRPLDAARAAAAADLARYDRIAARIAADGPAVARVAAARRGSLATIVAARAARAGLAVARIDPQGSVVVVGFDSVAADALIDWLAALDADVGVGVVDLKIERREAGMVAAEISVRER